MRLQGGTCELAGSRRTDRGRALDSSGVTKPYRCLIAMALACAISHTAFAQTPAALAEAYIREGQALNLRYLTSHETSHRNAWLAFITDGSAWISDGVGDGALEFFRKAGLYGGATLTLEEPVLAGQAARMPGRLQMTELAGYAWPVRVDLIEVEGVWRLRALRLTSRRPFPSDAGPMALVHRYLDHLGAGLARLEAMSEDIPLHQALGQELAAGAGFWTGDGRISAVTVYSHLKSIEPETVDTELLSVAGDAAAVRLRTERARRTYVQVSEWQMVLSRHATRGWEISGLERTDAETRGGTASPDEPVTPAAPSGGFDSTVNLVEHVLELAASHDPVAFGEAVAPFFVATRDGRRAAGRLVVIRQFSGAVTPRWSVSDAGAGRVRAEAIDGGPALKMMMPVIIFDTSSEDGLRITAVEFRRE